VRTRLTLGIRGGAAHPNCDTKLKGVVVDQKKTLGKLRPTLLFVLFIAIPILMANGQCYFPIMGGNGS
jgi:hypothetical protein